jgi:hypothetical protein
MDMIMDSAVRPDDQWESGCITIDQSKAWKEMVPCRYANTYR